MKASMLGICARGAEECFNVSDGINRAAEECRSSDE